MDSEQVTKFGAFLPVPREFLIDCGMAQRTPAEQEAHDAQVATWRAEWDAAQPGIRAALAALDALGGLEREILDLHSRESDGYMVCDGCDFGGYDSERPGWPCRTVDLIATRHGIDVTNFHLYEPGR